MAKKPTKKNKFEDDAVSSAIVSKYGDIVESGNKVLNDLRELSVIGISPALDMALGGGLREGSVVIMTGDPKTGKTTTALYFAAKCQKLGKNVVYLNTEGRMTKENFTGIKGLDVEAIKIVQSTDEVPLISAEMYLNVLEMYIKQTPNLVAIIDSVSNMLPQEELEGEIRTGIRNGLPRLLSQFFKRIGPEVNRRKAILICVTHNIANTGGSQYAPKKMADSGNQLQYQGGTNMVITHRGKWAVPADSDNHVGQIANWLIKTSAAGGTPNSTAEGWIRYGVGIDEAQELGQIATEFGLIAKGEKSSWYDIVSIINGRAEKDVAKFLKSKDIDPNDLEAVSKLVRFQGMANVTDFLTENDFVVEYLGRKMKEMMS